MAAANAVTVIIHSDDDDDGGGEFANSNVEQIVLLSISIAMALQYIVTQLA